MKLSPNGVFNHLLPSGEELWQRAGADMQSTEIEQGRHIDVPFFDPRFTKHPSESQLSDTELRTKRGVLIGRQVLHRFEIDHINYLARVLLPQESLRGDNDLTIVDSTAWMTTIDGYVGDRDAKLVIDNNVPLIAVGAAFSAPPESLIDTVSAAPRAAYRSRKLSLAYSAEVEQKVVGQLSGQYDLPRRQLKLGDSRGANISLGQFAYAGTYGNEIIGFDTKGRCAPEKIELADTPEVAAWLAATVLGGIAVGGCLLSKGRADLLKGTTSLSPGFLMASLTGTMRTLASGETGAMIEWVPRSVHGHDLLYGLDSLANHELVEKLWKEHPNVVMKIVAAGNHASLLHPFAHEKQRERVGRTIAAFAHAQGNVAEMDWQHAHYGELSRAA